ncbi:hypothetical protein [Jiangella asiatica]|uniref:Uncharacterized protein n=1 Tax=Jiangella asiatica TaxID=2530372 RepID=A0A4R5CL82_9ACTN|nr:hypothetical protein [Jiangella asiatica]TDD99969.1 hypothetical protein E1269_26870 [Jiangella asiatica]
MNSRLDDALSRRLAGLDADLAGVALPGAAAARRRAAQRTRHQVTGGVLAGVAVIAAGVLAIGDPELTATPEPAPPATDAETPTTVPTTPTDEPTTPPADPSPDPSQVSSPDTGTDDGDTDGGGGDSRLDVPPGALLDLADVTGDSGADWAEAPPGDSWLPCVPPVPSAAKAASFAVGNSRFDHIVEPTEPGTAADRLAALRAQVTACADGGGDYDLIQVWELSGVGDEAYLLVWSGPPTTQETTTYVTASLARSGGYVSAVFRGGEGQDYNGVPGPDDAVRAIERLCGAIGTDCPVTPEQNRLYPEPEGDLEGWLTIDDLAEIGLTDITEGGEVSDNTDEYGWTDYGHVGLPRDPLADGAESLEHRNYADPMEPGGSALDQLRARFPDADTARAHYEALVTAADGFTQPGDVIENTGAVSGDGYEGMTWRAESEYGVFVYGALLRGDTVTVVLHSIASHSDGQPYDVPPEQMRRLLDLAGQRLGG